MPEVYFPSVTAFYIISSTVVVLAIMAVTVTNLVRAALALAFCFFSLAGIFWILGSPFVAVMQLLVNAGAIPIVTIFIVMMTHSRISLLRNRWSVFWSLFVAVPLGLAILVFAPVPVSDISYVVPLSVERLGVELLGQRGLQMTLSTGETVTVQGGALFAFEVTALILLVAFVGAIILARREDEMMLRAELEPDAGGVRANA